MKFSVEQYKTLSDRFNKMSFLQKLVTIKQNGDIMELYTDGYNWRLRLEEPAQKLELDLLFEFTEFSTFEVLKDICKLADLPVKELK